MVEQLDIEIPVSGLNSSIKQDSFDEFFNYQNSDCFDEIDPEVELHQIKKHERNQEADQIKHKKQSLVQELRESGDSDVDSLSDLDIENLSDVEVEKFKKLKQKLMYLDEMENVQAAHVVSAEMIELGITLSENVSSGIIASCLYKRLSAHNIESVKIGKETIQPISKDKIKNRIENIRDSHSAE